MVLPKKKKEQVKSESESGEEKHYSTNVYDLRSKGLKRVYNYSLPPEKAVIVAYYQIEKHNFNTWEYDFSEEKLCYGKNHKAVCCGNMAAILRREDNEKTDKE